MDPQRLLADAIQFHQSGQVAQAKQIYQQLLTLQPNHPDALHMLGVIASQAHSVDSSFVSVSSVIDSRFRLGRR